MDSAGAPVADALLALRGPEPDARDLLARELDDADVVVGRTRADGTFEVPSLAVGPWLLAVAASGWPVTEFSGRANVPGVQAGHVLVLESVQRIAGRVVADADFALERLVVVATAPPEQLRALGHRGARRELRTPCAQGGSFEFTGIPDRFQPVTFDLLVLDRYGSKEPLVEARTARPGDEDVTLTLQPATWVRFGLRDAGSTAPLASPIALRELWVGRSVRARNDVTSDVLPDASPGTYRLRIPRLPVLDGCVALSVSAEGYESALVRLPRLEQPLLDLGWILLAPLSVQRVRVVDAATGEPIAGARLHAAKVAELEQRHGDIALAGAIASGSEIPFHFTPHRFRVWTDDSGEASVHYSPVTPLLVVADHPGFLLSAPLELSGSARDEPPEIAMHRGAAVRVRVRSGSEPIAAIVTQRFEYPDVRRRLVYPASSSSSATDSKVTDDAGECVFAPLPPGTHFFRVDDLVEQPWHSLEVEGQGLYELTLPAPGSKED